ncbi:hypothetical protein MTR67_018844 [Solanum verrucosum]|uniref:Reverse transcriptase zinc-binding domain-containing protein n=1 Tax=Solanum verrucosum TaxID=315347 RepID=A0AAF0QT37_SOLVR|nr:hypothetical protein MTR67_018844 [Solanum verrucosum]
METLFPNIHNLVLQQQSTIAHLCTPQRWNFVFRRHLNDWEIPRVTEFFRSIDQFSCLETGRDRLQWLGSSKGIFKLGAAYKKLNHQNLQLLKWPWRHIWKAKIPCKVSCFVWLLAEEAVLTQENLMKRRITLCSRCWKAKIPYKVSCFVWLLAKEAVLTQDNLVKRRITLCSRCFFCGKTAKTVNPLFIQCEVSGQLWNLFLRLKHVLVHAWEISEALYSWEEEGTQAKNRSNWRIVPATIWWTILKERNLSLSLSLVS